jgi:hypothetical protein
VLYLQHIHYPVSYLVEVLKQLNNLLFKLEVARVDLWASTIFRSELVFSNHDWVWVEKRFTVLESNRLQAAEIDFLEQFEQPASVG